MVCVLSFTDLYFGMADAKNEATEHPDEFIRSFVDHQGAVEALRQRRKFLLLGPKGAGKSAVAWYLELTGGQHGCLVSTRDVSELPLPEIQNLKTGEAAGVGRTVTAWKLLVLCGLLDLMLADESSSASRDDEVLRVAKALREYGFLDPTPARAIITATKTTLKVPLPKIGEVYSRETSASLHLHHLVPFLQKWLAENRSGNSYTLVLDGLDSVYMNDPQFIPSISALVQAIYLVNQDLRRDRVPAQVVALVRNDVFSRLTLADAGKIRQDFGVDIDWRVLSGEPRKAALFTLVGEKAGSLIGVPGLDVVSTFLPAQVTLGGGHAASRPIHNYLLDHTRHTPRDLLRLFEYLRTAAQEFGLAPGEKLNQDMVREGVLRYATRYFVDAIRNEFVGREVDSELPHRAVNALRELAQRQFSAAEFTTVCFGDNSSESRQEAEKVLRWLFFAGAIGNVVPGGAGQTYLQFFHRRDDSEVYLKRSLVLHSTLMYAWAIPWS